ncbi:isoleucine--tRNA ligase [uncultured Helicobacter sp.]|uniref:isoleucine--tRNA ligase n=1 Tax=uncultured Helicobacter sp. TaxID=175537 RepID=UPI00374F14D2
MDYKDTLILPNTDFPMRGNLPQNEPQVYAKWREEKIYARMCDTNAPQQSFTLHDGPPYANGHIHIGHALNKILKDMVVKLHYFQGHKIAYTPGWDCHGLPIEQKVEEKIGKDKKDNLPKTEIRELCREWAREFIGIQSEEFQDLGVLGDFENPYKTMDFAFEAEIYRALCEIAKQGLLIERSKPVFWSWAAKSALAEAEVEYQDKEDYSIFVGFDLSAQSSQKLGVNRAKAIIWTTTPWTLPANQAICLNANEEYVITKDSYIIAKPLLQSLVEIGITTGEIAKSYQGREFENLEAINPLNGRISRMILGDHVLMSGGSGLVHTAPGHGEDDYYACLKYDIEVLMPVDDGGCYDETLKSKKLLPDRVVDSFIGVHVFKANEKILELLGDNLLYASKFTHSYPFCWRTHKPVIYRATKQWFILMDKPFSQSGETLREVALRELQKVRFYPEHGRNRISSMIENRPDWCISRQRDWGVPIAFFKDKRTGDVVLDSEILEFVAQVFEQEGCDAWWSKSIEELLPPSHKTQSAHYEKIHHILDVWFDSGSTWKAVLQSHKYNAGEYPASMYLEGSDQHRGWFQSSLLVSCAIHKKAPYTSILTHGFTMDENGEKMSKSKGNVIAPQEILKNYGSDSLRLWVALCDYLNDQRISQNILKQVSEQYKKIRNTIRFLLANTQDLRALTSLDSEIDYYIVTLANDELEQALKLFLEYEFAKGFSVIMNFVSTHLSGVYMDLCKDSLYCDGLDSARRTSIQSAMAFILKKLLFVIAPTLTYTAYEAFGYANACIKAQARDVFDLRNPSVDDVLGMQSHSVDKVDFARLMKIREKFGEAIDGLKKDKIIKSSLELCVVSHNDKEFSELDRWLIVSSWSGNKEGLEVLKSFEVELESGVEHFAIARAKAHKCPRCWQFVAQSAESLCVRCQQVIDTL